MNHIRQLLIVPYGIETRLWRWSIRVESLLIVPYGIETSEPEVGGKFMMAF